MIRILYSDEFCKEFKSLAKKRRSLGELEWEGDFEVLKNLIKENPTGNVCVERIDQLGDNITLPVYKVRKFYCADLKSNNKLRVIYIYDEYSEEIRFIQFIELYAKADKEGEDRKRIEKYAKGKRHIDDSDTI